MVVKRVLYKATWIITIQREHFVLAGAHFRERTFLHVYTNIFTCWCHSSDCSLAHWTCISSATTACLEDGLRLLFLTLKDSFMVYFFDFSMIVPGLHVKLLCDPIKMGMTLSHCPATEKSAATVRLSEKPGQ